MQLDPWQADGRSMFAIGLKLQELSLYTCD